MFIYKYMCIYLCIFMCIYICVYIYLYSLTQFNITLIVMTISCKNMQFNVLYIELQTRHAINHILLCT